MPNFTLDLHCQKIERTLAVDSYRLTASTPLRIHSLESPGQSLTAYR